MPETLTDAQKVLRNSTGLDMVAQLGRIADGVAANINLGLTGASVGDLVRVAAVDANGKPTSWNHVPLCDIVTNENLLDNSYFVGGGSQQGGGQFPINQRGQTSYTSTNSYTIDRWKTSSTGSVDINNNGLTLSSTSATTRRGFSQILPESLLGKKVTATILLTDGRLITGSNTLPSTPTGSQQLKSFAPFDGNEIRASMSSGGTLQFDVMVKAGDSISVAAVKLELGSTQTLAHNEGTAASPNWVLNEIPDYQQELSNCQRYFQVYRSQSFRPTYGMDFRPVMATDEPTLGTMTIDNVTYYTASAEL